MKKIYDTVYEPIGTQDYPPECPVCGRRHGGRPCSGCGHHNSFWATVIESPQWKLWQKEQSLRPTRDMAECEELGIISPEHFQEFIQYVRENF